MIQFETSNSASDTSNSTVTATITAGAYPNRALVIGCFVGNDTTINTPTVNGSATGVTLIGSVTNAGGMKISAFYKLSPDAGLNTVTYTIVSTQNLGISVATYYNVQQVNSIGTASSASLAGGDVIIRLASGLDGALGDLAIDFMGWSNVTNTTASPTNAQTQRVNNLDTIMRFGTSDLAFPTTPPTMDWTLSETTQATLLAVSLHAEEERTQDITMPRQFFQSWS